MSLSRHSTLPTRQRIQIRLKLLIYAVALISVFLALNIDCPPDVIAASLAGAIYLGPLFGLLLAVWTDDVIHKLEYFSFPQFAKLLATDCKVTLMLLTIGIPFAANVGCQFETWAQATYSCLFSPMVGAMPAYLIGRKWMLRNRERKAY